MEHRFATFYNLLGALASDESSPMRLNDRDANHLAQVFVSRDNGAVPTLDETRGTSLLLEPLALHATLANLLHLFNRPLGVLKLQASHAHAVKGLNLHRRVALLHKLDAFAAASSEGLHLYDGVRARSSRLDRLRATHMGSDDSRRRNPPLSDDGESRSVWPVPSPPSLHADACDFLLSEEKQTRAEEEQIPAHGAWVG